MQGHGRSAVTAAAILMAMGQAGTADEALAKVVKVRAVPEMLLGPSKSPRQLLWGLGGL